MVALSTIVPQLELYQVIQELEFMEKTIGVQEEAIEVDPIEVIKIGSYPFLKIQKP